MDDQQAQAGHDPRRTLMRQHGQVDEPAVYNENGILI